ncbi:hypothetical protein [Halomonas shantousis]
MRSDISGRAIYLYIDGELVQRHNELDELIEFDIDCLNEEEALKKAGYRIIDTLDQAYTVYGTTEHSSASHTIKNRLEGIRYIVDVNTDNDACYFILVRDNLPDYLAVLAMLQPLLVHKKGVQESTLAS